MDTSTETIDQTAGSGEATATSQAGSSTGSETVASESSQGQDSNAGGEQSFSESGKDQGTDPRRTQFRSKNQTIFELRQKLRERDSYWEGEVGSMKEQLANIQKMFSGGQERKPSRTFYEAPEDTLRAIQQENLKSFKDELLTELRQTEEERMATYQLKQEASEAAKFIRSQKGITEDDIQEIRELLQDDPVARQMAQTPLEQANYILYKWEKSKGITDKTDLKNKARTVQGAGTQTGTGESRIWTEDEMKKEFDKLGDVRNWGPDEKKKARLLEAEFMKAYADKRVKK